MECHVVIIGGGFGGLEAAFTLRELAGRSCSVTLVDRNDFHVFIPSIHEIVSGKTTAESLRVPFGTILGPAGIRFVRDEVLSIDRELHEVRCGRETLRYDYLLIAAGAENNFFGIPGAEKTSFCFRRPDDAARIRAAATLLLEDPFSSCRIVLAGGGTEGVEAAGELLDLVCREGREDDLGTGQVSIDLIEEKDRLLAGFPAEAGECALRYLQGRGVNIMTGRAIVAVENDTVVLSGGERRPASVLVWTGGIRPSKVIRDLPLRKDDRGWLAVTGDLHAPEDDRIYGIGDAVSIMNGDGPLLLQRLAYHAEDQGRAAAKNIAAHIAGLPLTPYTPRVRPQLISLGRDQGIYVEGERVVSGTWVGALKKAVERRHIMGCVSRPVASAVLANVPGADLIRNLRMRWPR